MSFTREVVLQYISPRGTIFWLLTSVPRTQSCPSPQNSYILDKGMLDLPHLAISRSQRPPG